MLLPLFTFRTLPSYFCNVSSGMCDKVAVRGTSSFCRRWSLQSVLRCCLRFLFHLWLVYLTVVLITSWQCLWLALFTVTSSSSKLHFHLQHLHLLQTSCRAAWRRCVFVRERQPADLVSANESESIGPVGTAVPCLLWSLKFAFLALAIVKGEKKITCHLKCITIICVICHQVPMFKKVWVKSKFALVKFRPRPRLADPYSVHSK